ncbi:MAG: hypothetical protein ACK5NT_13250 [Pyrinomonadaceae bacterium]
MWQSITKHDLIIEVWEKLDCEDVGRKEIEAIEVVVAEQYGITKTDSPMRLARILADEGAVLRHSEILQLDYDRRTASPHKAIFNNLANLGSLRETESTISQAEAIRKKFLSVEDNTGLKQLREIFINRRAEAERTAESMKNATKIRYEAREIANWLSVWISTPEVFFDWLKVRKRSEEFKKRFIEDK